MKSKFSWTSPCLKDIENTSVAFSLILSIFIVMHIILTSLVEYCSFAITLNHVHKHIHKYHKNKLFAKFSASWPLSSKKKTITMATYVKSMVAFTLLRH